LRFLVLGVVSVHWFGQTRPYFEKSVLQALIELFTLVLHILHFYTGVVFLAASSPHVIYSILTIFQLLLVLFQGNFVAEIIIGVWNSSYKILEGVLTESPYILNEKLLRSDLS